MKHLSDHISALRPHKEKKAVPSGPATQITVLEALGFHNTYPAVSASLPSLTSHHETPVATGQPEALIHKSAS
jgi:hypothetical protein